jgi:integrase
MDKILSTLPVFTFKKFEDAFYGHQAKPSDLYGIYQDYIDQVYQENRIKTAVSYQTALNSLKKFAPKISIYDVDEKFLKRYHAFLEAEGKSLSTIGIYMRSLRAVYNFAISKKVLKKDEDYPFVRNKYTIPSSNNVKKALTLEEVKLIFDCETLTGTFADRSKDFWIFSYLCNGINFKDIALLKWKNIDGDMIRFVRQKTKRSTQGNQKIISCHASDQVQAIIEKWGTKAKKPDDYIFSIIDKDDSPVSQQKKIDLFIQNTNKNLKRICKSVGINKPVTTYYSRHSAATVLKLSGASVEEIQELLGHSSSKITQKYLDSFRDDRKKVLAQKLTLFRNGK